MDYLNMPQEELIAEIERLKRSKKYGLIWEEKPEKVDLLLKDNYPVLSEVTTSIPFDENLHVNLLLEGDNLHSLYLLNTTHNNSVDCILIDPPYNTGNKDFIYNDEYIDRDDIWRHSKWISFMNKRLRLARLLLKDEGVIFIHIDENEFAQLKLLCDEIFSDKNFVGAFVWKARSGKGGTADKIATEHEYIYCYAKNYEVANIKAMLSVKQEETEQLRQWGQGQENYRERRPSMFFPLLYKEETNKKSTITEEEYKELYDANSGDFNDEFLATLRQKYESEGWAFVLPILPDGKYGRWRSGRNTIISQMNETDESEPRIDFRKSNGIYEAIKVKPANRESITAYGTLLIDHGTASTGTKELNMIFKEKIFDTTKPLDVTTFLIDLAMYNKNEGVVVDFFAGSGTTGHAVLKYNQKFNKNINFILCNDNEVSETVRKRLIRNGLTPEMEEFKNEGVCRKVTLPKLEAVILGYDYEGNSNEVLEEVKVNKTFIKNMREIYESWTSLFTDKNDEYDKFEVKVADDKIKIIGVKKISDTVTGIPANLKYFRTDLIPKTNNKDYMKIIMANKIHELLCIRENCFQLEVEKPYYRIYKQGNKITCIYSMFQNDYIDEFKQDINTISAEDKIVYSFSFSTYIDYSLFKDLSNVKVLPIPIKILEMLDELRIQGGNVHA